VVAVSFLAREGLLLMTGLFWDLGKGAG
jgi:hypothetical protein